MQRDAGPEDRDGSQDALEKGEASGPPGPVPRSAPPPPSTWWDFTGGTRTWGTGWVGREGCLLREEGVRGQSGPVLSTS